jgi:hypothetical protein
MSDIKTIYHGSTDIVKVPVFGHGKINNDYGIGFYCTEDNRADDSYFQIAESFLSNQLALEVIADALHLGKLGRQFVLISNRAFDEIKYVCSDLCSANELYDDYILNDKTARLYFRQLLQESFNNGKTFVRDLLGGR